MTLTAQCDTCKREVSGDELHTDYDGIDRCATCARNEELRMLRAERDQLKEWLEKTHLEKLRNLETKISELVTYA